MLPVKYPCSSKTPCELNQREVIRLTMMRQILPPLILGILLYNLAIKGNTHNHDVMLRVLLGCSHNICQHSESNSIFFNAINVMNKIGSHIRSAPISIQLTRMTLHQRGEIRTIKLLESVIR